MAAEKQRWRLNGIVGKLVPSFLLVYMILVYRLVIIDYSYIHLALRKGRFKAGLVNIAALHVFFLPALWAYLRVFLARTSTLQQPDRTSWSSLFKGAPLSQPPFDPPEEIRTKQIFFECDSKGDPIRCHRDQCKGRWKPARSRHCGDCRQCRLALDHHCPWFDADVMASQTLKPFLLFLGLVPPLLILAFGPLSRLAYHHVCFIWKHARSSDYVKTVWWSRKRSWVGGPMYRWLVGLWLGSRDCCRSVSNPFEEPNLYLPLLLFLAIALILVASALLLSTLQQLVEGDLTIDARVRKIVLRQTISEGEQRGQRYFWIPLSDHKEGGVVVACPVNEQPYDLGSWKENLRAFLCLPPYSAQQLQLQWPVSSEVYARFLTQAQRQIRKAA